MQKQELRELVGQNIRARRIELELTQGELAGKIRITQAYLSQIENGIRSIDVDLLAPMAEALRTTPTALLSSGTFFSTTCS